MRKLISFLLIAVLAISMTACSINSTGSTSSETEIPSKAISVDAEDKNTDNSTYTPSKEETETPGNATSVDVRDENTDNSNYTPSKEYDNVYPQHEPYGTGIGAMPGRVVWAHDPDAVEWDGNGYWWNLNNFDESAILKMVNDSIATFGGRTTAADDWTVLFQSHNGGAGYQPGQKIVIKANINGSAVFDDDTSGETKMSYTNPVVLKALLRSLVEEASVVPSDITVYDVSRLFPDYMVEMCTEGNLKGVQFVGRKNGVADEQAPINWSYEFSGNVNYIPTCVTEAEYVINLANLKGHSYGITLCGKNHFGSFINGDAMFPPQGANLHQSGLLCPPEESEGGNDCRWVQWVYPAGQRQQAEGSPAH